MNAQVRVAVLLGGVVGTGLRAAVAALVPVATFPLATLLVNLVGAFGLGFLAGSRPDAPPRLRAFLGTGLLGSFTTFSALAVDVVALGDRAGLLVVYALASIAGGLALARLGRSRGAATAVAP